MIQITENIYQINTIEDLYELLIFANDTHKSITLISNCSKDNKISNINFGLIDLADTTSIYMNQHKLVGELNEQK